MGADVLITHNPAALGEIFGIERGRLTERCELIVYYVGGGPGVGTAPYKSGHLQRSHEFTVEDRPEGLVAKVFTVAVPYAAPLLTGTSRMAARENWIKQADVLAVADQGSGR